jgi:hypothetical protein
LHPRRAARNKWFAHLKALARHAQTFPGNSASFSLSRVGGCRGSSAGKPEAARDERKKEIAMRSDGPLIGAVLFLGGGLGVIIGYCHGTTGFSAAYPFSGAFLHLDMTTTGPGVLGGLALGVIGAFFLVWAFLAAIVSLFTSSSESGDDSLKRYSVVPAYEDRPQAEAPAQGAEQQEGFWSSPSAGSQI